MKNKLVAGFMAATMMVSVMSTGVFAKELNPDTVYPSGSNHLHRDRNVGILRSRRCSSDRSCSCSVI